MQVIIKKGEHYVEIPDQALPSNPACLIEYIVGVNGWEGFIGQAINYCTGKTSRTIISWFSRVNSTLRPTIKESELKEFPNCSAGWELFVSNWYLMTLCTEDIKASVKTRAETWNKNLRPFLLFLQDRDLIPVDVIVPVMKPVDQIETNSSFSVSVIGDRQPRKVTHKDSMDKLISPVSLSRTDAEYLDELYCDLERKRNKVYECAKLYWQSIKKAYLLGKRLMGNIDQKRFNERVESKEFYDILRESNGLVPRHRVHFAARDNEESLGYLLHILKTEFGSCKLLTKTTAGGLAPSYAGVTKNTEYYRELIGIETQELNNSPKRYLNWMLGILDNRDTAVLAALLIMEHPKFTPFSLIQCKVFDKNGKSMLEVDGDSYTLSIEKARAKAYKREKLSQLSLDVVNTLIDMRNEHADKIPDKYSKYLFLVCSARSKSIGVASLAKVSLFLVGRDGSDSGASAISSAAAWLGSLYPELNDYGIRRGTLTLSKLRHTEGVLEFFRTGSVRSVSRKLGNSKNIALKHYLPKPLIAAFNTRQVRRFQNLLIATACRTEDYLLEAVDFNTVGELNDFIYNMIQMDGNGSNPILKLLKDGAEIDSDSRKGELVANISERSLAYLYAYNNLAESSNVSGDALLKKDCVTGLSPMSIVLLSKYLKETLSNHSEASVRSVSDAAYHSALDMSNKLNWGDLLLSMDKAA